MSTDVLIAGGGPAGSALARRLATTGRSVAVLEASRYETSRVGESLAPSVRPLLSDLGVWERFLALAPIPSWGTASWWGAAGHGANTHLISPYQQGWHVDRCALDEMLVAAAGESGAQVWTGRRIANVRYESPGWVVTDQRGDRLRARLLVDATGRRSPLRRMLGVSSMNFDRLVSIGARSEARRDVAHVAVETSADGWWYSAPLPDGSAMTLLLTDADICRAQRLADARVWSARVRQTREIASRVQIDSANAAIQVCTAASGRARRADLRPWLAVGDAALSVDPLTGSGVVRALRSAEEAIAAVTVFLDGGASHWGEELMAYERARDIECTQYLRTRLEHYAAACPAGSTGSLFWSRRYKAAQCYHAWSVGD